MQSRAAAEPQAPDHPVLMAVARVAEALGEVATVNPSFMHTPEKAAALAELARVESQVAELRLRILGDAEDVAAGFAAPRRGGLGAVGDPVPR
jgi:hypothetical protein